jgi:hypothetical protein
MVAELDWDSLDSGCLHWTVSRAKTLSGEQVIVGVLDDPSMFSDALQNAEEAREPDWKSPPAPLWLYVPNEMNLVSDTASSVVLKRVRSA